MTLLLSFKRVSSLFWLPIGVALPACFGWMLLRLLEWRSPVLTNLERATYGFLLGLTATMFLMFLLHIALGVPFSRAGFLAVEGGLTIAVAVALRIASKRTHAPLSVFHSPQLPSSPALPAWGKILLAILAAWTVLKIVAGGFILVATPPFFDDTINNWNIRGKVFYHTQKLELMLPSQRPGEEPSTISAYPPSVPLAKASLAAIAGAWDEGVVNGLHLLWLLASLGIVFTTLRRAASLPWAMLGTYLLAALPLYLVQGTSAYADVFLSAHIAAAAALLFHAVCATEREERTAWLRLAALATALLPFTKNEGLVLYLPAMLLLAGVALAWMWRTGRLTAEDARRAAAWYLGLLLAVVIPWIGFKWARGMPFGNAKAISGLAISWQKGVLYAILINTFFEGNWLLIFPLLALLLVVRWRAAFRTPAVLFSAFFLLLYAGQIPLFLFTTLSTEVLMQTGYARGLVHLMPVVAILATLLLRDLFARGTEPLNTER